MIKDKSKEIALIAFMLTVIVGVVSWKLLSTHQFFIMFTALFTALITILIFHLNTVKRTLSTITMAMNSTVRRVANINYWCNDKLCYVVAVVIIGLWLASSVFDGTKVHLAIKEFHHEIYVVLAVGIVTTVYVSITLLIMGSDWEDIIRVISMIALALCFPLFIMVFVLLIV